LQKINTNAPLSLQINSKRFLRGENEYIDNVQWKAGIAKDIVLKDGSYIIIDIHKLIPSGAKELNETRGKVISDYQNLLEKEWLLDLKSKYVVKINMEVLYSLIK